MATDPLCKLRFYRVVFKKRMPLQNKNFPAHPHIVGAQGGIPDIFYERKYACSTMNSLYVANLNSCKICRHIGINGRFCVSSTWSKRRSDNAITAEREPLRLHWKIIFAMLKQYWSKVSLRIFYSFPSVSGLVWGIAPFIMQIKVAVISANSVMMLKSR